MKYGVIYARYSSHSQNEQTIETQLELCQGYAREKGITIVNTYIDKALTGTKDKRTSFLRLIRDSKKQTPRFDCVICYKFDRYARNAGDDFKYRGILAENNVQVLSVMEQLPGGASGTLMRNIIAAYNGFFSDNLSENITIGMAKNAEKHYTTGSLPLGLKSKNKKIVIDEEQAEAVKFIFKSYLEDKTNVEIANTLNRRGYKTKQGGEFNKNSFHTILRNKRYIGIYTFKGKEDPDTIPRILDDDTFYKVQEKLAKNEKIPAKSKAGDKVEYLLTGYLKCGKCKKLMTGYGGTSKTGKMHRYYKCNGVKQKHCDKKNARKDWIEDFVVAQCRNILTDDNIEKIAEEVIKATNAGNIELIHSLNQQLKKEEKIKSNLFDTLKLCEDDDIRREIIGEISQSNKNIDDFRERLEKEKNNTFDLTEEEIIFFLNGLREGDVNDIRYRRLLIHVFVHEIYLYDDKIKIFFNTSNIPTEVEASFVDEIGETKGTQGCSTMTKTAPPKFKKSTAEVLFLILVIQPIWSKALRGLKT
ncbi:MAG: recombinase family protein [Clostridia bacterium]|nr:recombinase family protein [Clostridia bacterium]